MVFWFSSKCCFVPNVYCNRNTRSEQVLEGVSSNSWWKSIDKNCCVINAETLEKICILQTAVSPSANNERVFSTFGLVHSKLRNRGVEKAGKLVFLHKVLNK